MIAPGDKIIVALYIRGQDLDPDLVTKQLGIAPSRFQHKGEVRKTSTNRDYVTKIGLWCLISYLDSQLVNEHIENLALKIGATASLIRGIPEVQQAYFDVFIATESDIDGEGGCEFELSDDTLAMVSKIGLPVRFTVSVVRESQQA